MDSYDNDWLFLNDDLFVVWDDEYLERCHEPNQLNRECAMQRLEDKK